MLIDVFDFNIMLYRIHLAMKGVKPTTLVVISTDCTGTVLMLILTFFHILVFHSLKIHYF
jgi:hypothetical protein